MAKPLRVLGIDPGSVVCGYGLVRRQGSVLTLEDCGVFRPKRQAPFPERLRFLYEGLEALIAETTPDAMAIEAVFFARHARSALQLGHARGVLLLAAARADVPIFEYPPAAVKKAVTGDGAAQGSMDAATAKGLTPEVVAARILRAAARGRDEVVIAGREGLAVWLKRFLPGIFNRMIAKARVT